MVSAPLLSRDVEVSIISTKRCCVIDNVCLGQVGATSDFLFFYSCFSTDLYICFPFDEFTMGVTDLSPDMRHDASKPFPRSFLHYYSCWPNNPMSWISLMSQLGSSIFFAICFFLQKF